MLHADIILQSKDVLRHTKLLWKRQRPTNYAAAEVEIAAEVVADDVALAEVAVAKVDNDARGDLDDDRVAAAANAVVAMAAEVASKHFHHSVARHSRGARIAHDPEVAVDNAGSGHTNPSAAVADMVNIYAVTKVEAEVNDDEASAVEGHGCNSTATAEVDKTAVLVDLA